MVKSNKVLYEKVNSIKKSDSEDKIRMELFSIFTHLVLSKSIFPRNSDLKDFVDSIDKEFKAYRPYLYNSRTTLLARILKDINNKEKINLYHLSLDLKKFVSEVIVEDQMSQTSNKNTNISTNEKNNYTDSLFRRFKRGD